MGVAPPAPADTAEGMSRSPRWLLSAWHLPRFSARRAASAAVPPIPQPRRAPDEKAPYPFQHHGHVQLGLPPHLIIGQPMGAHLDNPGSLRLVGTALLHERLECRGLGGGGGDPVQARRGLRLDEQEMQITAVLAGAP